MTLLEETRQLLQGVKLSPIAKKTGFSYQWLWQVQKGKTKSPNVQAVEKLHAYLTK